MLDRHLDWLLDTPSALVQAQPRPSQGALLVPFLVVPGLRCRYELMDDWRAPARQGGWQLLGTANGKGRRAILGANLPPSLNWALFALRFHDFQCWGKDGRWSPEKAGTSLSPSSSPARSGPSCRFVNLRYTKMTALQATQLVVAQRCSLRHPNPRYRELKARHVWRMGLRENANARNQD
jgi:hypothetical protein